MACQFCQGPHPVTLPLSNVVQPKKGGEVARHSILQWLYIKQLYSDDPNISSLLALNLVLEKDLGDLSFPIKYVLCHGILPKHPLLS